MERTIRIPERNIYMILCYAWDINYHDSTFTSSNEASDILNLLAKLLVEQTNKIVKRGMLRNYINEDEDLRKPKGQINITDSINRILIPRKRLSCNFDEYSNNILFNQIIKTTLQKVNKCSGLDKNHSSGIKKILPYFEEVDVVELSSKLFSSIRFDKNNINYRFILNICKLLVSGLMANNIISNKKEEFFIFDDEKTMASIYEQFLFNFYTIKFANKYKVSRTNVKWELESDTSRWQDLFDIEKDPCNRRTDIVIDNNKDKIEFILDAKYYKNFLVTKYHSNEDDKTYISSHINQVRGYILDSKKQREDYEVIGGLIYSAFAENELERGKMIMIIGSNIVVKTINLEDSWENIENDLIRFARKILDKNYCEGQR